MSLGQPKGTTSKFKEVGGMAGNAWTNPTKIGSLTCYLSLVDIFMNKIEETDGLLPEILSSLQLFFWWIQLNKF